MIWMGKGGVSGARSLLANQASDGPATRIASGAVAPQPRHLPTGNARELCPVAVLSRMASRFHGLVRPTALCIQDWWRSNPCGNDRSVDRLGGGCRFSRVSAAVTFGVVTSEPIRNEMITNLRTWTDGAIPLAMKIGGRRD